MKTIRCIVAALNSNGEPDLFFVKVECTEAQYEKGFHYETAKKAADENGYDALLAYDENDSAGNAMLPLCVWESVSTILCDL